MKSGMDNVEVRGTIMLSIHTVCCSNRSHRVRLGSILGRGSTCVDTNTCIAWPMNPHGKFTISVNEVEGWRLCMSCLRS